MSIIGLLSIYGVVVRNPPWPSTRLTGSGNLVNVDTGVNLSRVSPGFSRSTIEEKDLKDAKHPGYL